MINPNIRPQDTSIFSTSQVIKFTLKLAKYMDQEEKALNSFVNTLSQCSFPQIICVDFDARNYNWTTAWMILITFYEKKINLLSGVGVKAGVISVNKRAKNILATEFLTQSTATAFISTYLFLPTKRSFLLQIGEKRDK